MTNMNFNNTNSTFKIKNPISIISEREINIENNIFRNTKENFNKKIYTKEDHSNMVFSNLLKENLKKQIKLSDVDMLKGVLNKNMRKKIVEIYDKNISNTNINKRNHQELSLNLNLRDLNTINDNKNDDEELKLNEIERKINSNNERNKKEIHSFGCEDDEKYLNDNETKKNILTTDYSNNVVNTISTNNKKQKIYSELNKKNLNNDDLMLITNSNIENLKTDRSKAQVHFDYDKVLYNKISKKRNIYEEIENKLKLKVGLEGKVSVTMTEENLSKIKSFESSRSLLNENKGTIHENNGNLNIKINDLNDNKRNVSNYKNSKNNILRNIFNSKQIEENKNYEDGKSNINSKSKIKNKDLIKTNNQNLKHNKFNNNEKEKDIDYTNYGTTKYNFHLPNLKQFYKIDNTPVTTDFSSLVKLSEAEINDNKKYGKYQLNSINNEFIRHKENLANTANNFKPKQKNENKRLKSKFDFPDFIKKNL